MRTFITILFLICILSLASDQAQARDLVDAAQSAQSVFNRIGIAAISIGITLGGILFALGAAQIINVHHFEGGIVPGVPQDETADPAVAVQQAFRCHRAIALLLLDEGTNE